MEERFLTIMDYSTGSINIYKYKKTDPRTAEEIMEDYGYKKSECSYMISDELILKYY